MEEAGPLIVIMGESPWSSDLERLIAGGADTFLSTLTVNDFRGPKVRNVALGVVCAVGIEEMLLRWVRPAGFTGENEEGGVPGSEPGEDCFGPKGSMFRNDLNFGIADGVLDGCALDADGLCPMSPFMTMGVGEGETLLCLNCAGCDGLPKRGPERGDGSREKAERPNEPFDAFRGTGAAMTGM